METVRPHLVFLSGTLRSGSQADLVAEWCARQCPDATTAVFTGADLEFPFFRTGVASPGARVNRYLSELAAADGVVLVSPVYHGTASGLLKNALDYVNYLADDSRPFLDGRAIGCVALAMGDQGAASTIATLRTVAHALRGWPTPLGVTLTGELAKMRPDGEPVQAQARQRLGIMLDQVRSLAGHNAAARSRDGLLPSRRIRSATPTQGSEIVPLSNSVPSV